MRNLDELKLSFPEMDEIEKRSTKGGCNDPDGIYYHPKHVQQWLEEFGKDCDPKGLTYLAGTLKEVEITGKKPTPPPSPYGYPIFDPFSGQVDQPPLFPYRPGGGRDEGKIVPTSQMTVDPQMRKFLNAGEDFSSTIYRSDKNGGDGPPTIGYGHKLTPADIANKTFEGRSISREEAIELFNRDLAIAVSSAQRNIYAQVSQQQFDAYVSFAYQQGSNGAADSAVNTLINQGRFQDAANVLRHFSDNNTASPGLKHRRAEEADLFEKGDYTFAPY